MKFKDLLLNVLFGVIPFFIITLVLVFLEPENTVITTESSIKAIIYAFLYWVLFAFVWSLGTIVMYKIGSYLRKVFLNG